MQDYEEKDILPDDNWLVVLFRWFMDKTFLWALLHAHFLSARQWMENDYSDRVNWQELTFIYFIWIIKWKMFTGLNLLSKFSNFVVQKWSNIEKQQINNESEHSIHKWRLCFLDSSFTWTNLCAELINFQEVFEIWKSVTISK